VGLEPITSPKGDTKVTTRLQGLIVSISFTPIVKHTHTTIPHMNEIREEGIKKVLGNKNIINWQRCLLDLNLA